MIAKETAAESRRRKSPEEPPGARELFVCDIMGAFGLYQWSICLFATLYSALFAVTVVVGPIWTPDMNHLCADGDLEASNETSGAGSAPSWPSSASFSGGVRQCSRTVSRELLLGSGSSAATATAQTTEKCTKFLYDEHDFGRVLTNSVSSSLRPFDGAIFVPEVAAGGDHVAGECSANRSAGNGNNRLLHRPSTKADRSIGAGVMTSY